MDALATIWILGSVPVYFVLKSYRSDHAVFFALVWPVGAAVLGIIKLTQMQDSKVQPVETTAAPPPPPKLGGIGSDDDED